MLHATPNNMFSWDFTVWKDGREIAVIDMSWFREKADVLIAGQQYSVLRESMLEGTFVLRQGNHVLSRARKPSALLRRFDVEVNGRQLDLRATSAWKREFGLFDNQTQVGRVSPANWLGRKAAIELPDDMPLAVQVFVFWLVLVLWRRSASAGASGN